MTGDERQIGCREIERQIGAVADDRAGGFTGLPGNGDHAEVRDDGDAADNGGNQIG